MPVKQAANVVDLLDYFAEQQRPATLAEIARHFGWPRSSTFNLLTTLTGRGLLYEPKARGGYYPAPALSTLVQRIERAQPISQELQQLLEVLAAETGETAVLAATSGANALFVAAVESPQAVRYSAAPGKLIPLHVTATGRALLSQMTADERAAVLRKAKFERYTPTTLMSAAAVDKEIQRSLERGWFEGHAEYTRDLGGVALPLALPHRHLALLVAGPVFRVGDRVEKLARLMKTQVARHLPADPA
ncbi:MAG TPA: IclR family transcriptional regulator [Ramlibacter sp.]|nr:IclR family transcriptional regulator [Ramlibacter sp.]